MLPVIDLSQLKDGSIHWESVKQQVQNAFEEYGCFEALYAGYIPQNLRTSLFDELKRLFDLPLPIKLRNSTDKRYHGYIGQHRSVPLYESLGIVEPDICGQIESFTNLFWSEGNSKLSKSIESFCEQVAKLDMILRRMVVEICGLENHMDEHINSTYNVLRLNKYSAPHNDETKLGVTAHKDQNILTILCQNEVNGLKIMTKDGQWIDSNPSPDSLIVMIGDSFHAWTNGRVYSALHKVMMEEDVDRYSIGLFSVPKPGYIIKAPEEMVDEEHPLLFKPFDNAGYLKFFFTEGGKNLPESLKTYCGA